LLTTLADPNKGAEVGISSLAVGQVLWQRFRRLRNDQWHRKDIGIIRIGTTDDVANLVAFIVSPRNRWLPGATIDLDGGEVKGL
jgi:NAD(P)-dependent dehydrogenase (short-subunit alcohol dehydrogenase family)